MNDNDYDNFVDAVDKACTVIRKPAIDDENVINAWFEVLAQYDFKQVTDALSRLCVHPDSRYGITPALIIECMKLKVERELTWKGVIALARNPVTPIGVLARMHIKSFNLNEKQDIDLHHLAQEFLDDLPELKSKALAGEYTKHQVEVMIERGVNPGDPLMIGMPSYSPQDDNDPLRLTYRAARDGEYMAEVNARIASHEQNKIENMAGKRRAQEEMAKLFESKPVDQAAIDSDNAAFNRLMNKAGE